MNDDTQSVPPRYIKESRQLIREYEQKPRLSLGDNLHKQHLARIVRDADRRRREGQPA